MRSAAGRLAVVFMCLPAVPIPGFNAKKERSYPRIPRRVLRLPKQRSATSMGQEITNQPARQRKRQRAKPVAPPPDPEPSRLVVRSMGPIDQCKSLSLTFTEPEKNEECMITMEPIAEYRLPFMPEGLTPALLSRPTLTKASLPCGHGFNALALLYHFAKNSMTCPCCRAGHDKVQMGEQSVPPHLRRAFSQHLERIKADETREQIASDAITATRALEREVRTMGLMGGSLPVTRVMLTLHVFRSLDDGSLASWAQELPLTSSLSPGGLAFVSYGYSLHQVNLNLRFLPMRPAAFEIEVGLQNVLHGHWPLFRTARFPAEGPGRRIVFASGHGPAESMAVEVETGPNMDGCPVLTRMSWSVPLEAFSNMLLGMARADQGEIAAV
jgi:hypothetical protein